MNLLHKKKTVPEKFSTRVGIIHETHLPSACSEVEMRKMLNRFASNTPRELLDLTVSSKKVTLRRSNKKILSFKLKDLANDNLVSQSDCLVLVHKHHLIIVRFLSSSDLERFRRQVTGFSIKKECDQNSPSNNLPECTENEEPLREGSVDQACSQVVEKPPPTKSPDSQRREKSLPRFYNAEYSPRTRCSSPEVYLVKRTTKHIDGLKKSEYSRVTVYSIDQNYFDNASSTSSESMVE
ncbi:unnamed protein product [Hymenolepis diminuta]|uniref:RBD domain-containing protein n=1 Tax=Hymenolepis diminuta TaxID=6216 RepID=A0A0R3S9R1_HYMDI|nr:unnamed protein product [Hymenolepis diminuta]VUZ45817.1 unnamed protein product [Hymenolepis diminuta]